MRKYLIASMVPILTVVLHYTPRTRRASTETNVIARRSLQLHEMEQRQIELDRTIQAFRTNNLE